MHLSHLSLPQLDTSSFAYIDIEQRVPRKDLIVCPTATRTTTHKKKDLEKRKLASCKEVRQDDYVLACLLLPAGCSHQMA